MRQGNHIRVGVVGAGKMGEYHLRKYLELAQLEAPAFELVGFYEVDDERATAISEKYGVQRIPSLRTLFYEVDAVSIACPTPMHYSVTRMALESGVHCLVEKPLTDSLGETDELIAIAERNSLELHVGLVERFRLNALLRGLPRMPLSHIQSFRLNTAIGREPERDVITDLMIHDLDLVYALAGGDVLSHTISAEPIVTRNLDDAQVFLSFRSGINCHVAASRIARKLARGIRLVGPDVLYEVDFVENKVSGFFRDAEGNLQDVAVTVPDLDPLKIELSSFLSCVSGIPAPHVSARDFSASFEMALGLKSKATSPRRPNVGHRVTV